jgi:hypothetical protein
VDGPNEEDTQMALRITIDAFSGRQNPVVELDDATTRELAGRLKPGDPLKGDEATPPPESILGYRGVIVEQTGDGAIDGLPARLRIVDGKLFGDKLAHHAADPAAETFLSSEVLRLAKLDDATIAAIRKLIEARAGLVLHWPPIKWPTLEQCKCAPLYEPAWWNDGGQRQLHNNCYNYATNYRTDTFAQPGLGSGQIYPQPIACSGVRPAAIRDDVIDSPKADNKCPAEGHLVALVVAPGYDFHWYRKGRNGLWTHKPGSTQATNVDNSGHLITDPRTADRGPYTSFCTFMTVRHGHTKIR